MLVDGSPTEPVMSKLFSSPETYTLYIIVKYACA